MSSSKVLNKAQAINYMARHYKFTRETAARLFDLAKNDGESWHGAPCKSGYILVTSVGNTGGPYVTVEDAEKALTNIPGRVARPMPVGYTSRLPLKSGITTRREKGPQMATATRRGKAAAKAAEPEEVEEEAEVEEAEEDDEAKDYTGYADKVPTATMTDFHEWIVDNVYDGELPFEDVDEAFLKGVHLGGTLRMEFQRSDFNRERRAERKAAKPAAAKTEEPEEEAEEEVKPAARKTARSKTATTRPATKPAATRRRGGAKAAAAEAPF